MSLSGSMQSTAALLFAHGQVAQHRLQISLCKLLCYTKAVKVPTPALHMTLRASQLVALKVYQGPGQTISMLPPAVAHSISKPTPLTSCQAMGLSKDTLLCHNPLVMSASLLGNLHARQVLIIHCALPERRHRRRALSRMTIMSIRRAGKEPGNQQRRPRSTLRATPSIHGCSNQGRHLLMQHCSSLMKQHALASMACLHGKRWQPMAGRTISMRVFNLRVGQLTTKGWYSALTIKCTCLVVPSCNPPGA